MSTNSDKLSQADQLLGQGKWDEAISGYREFLKESPDNADAWVNLALAEEQKLDWSQAEEHLKKALEINSGHGIANFNLGVLLTKQMRFDEAAECFEKAYAAMPEDLDVKLYLAEIRSLKGQDELAEESFRDILMRSPGHPDAALSLGRLKKKQGKYDEAIELFQDILSRDISRRDAHLNLAQVELLRADFEAGWSHYVNRYKPNRQSSEIVPGKLLNDLRGKTIHILGEQGLGDEIFFMRYLCSLLHEGTKVCYYPDLKLKSMLRNSQTMVEIPTADAPPQDSEEVYFIGDLPILLDANDLGRIPYPFPLTPLPDRLNELQGFLSASAKPPYLGLTWRAGSQRLHALHKEVPLDQLLPIINQWEGSVIILQRDPRDEELEYLKANTETMIVDMHTLNDDLQFILACLSMLEVYVGVSNTNMHLAATVGCAARILVPWPPDWKWMASGDTSPWYPMYQVYRQDISGDWNEALAKLSADLRGS